MDSLELSKTTLEKILTVIKNAESLHGLQASDLVLRWERPQPRLSPTFYILRFTFQVCGSPYGLILSKNGEILNDTKIKKMYQAEKTV